jgi:hypothetical protein
MADSLMIRAYTLLAQECYADLRKAVMEPVVALTVDHARAICELAAILNAAIHRRDAAQFEPKEFPQ